MDIDAEAPVKARSSITLAAEPGDVWDVLIGIDRYAEWNSDIKWVSISGEVAQGKTFKWKAGPSVITSTVQEIDPGRRLVWTGQTMSIKAVHVWRIIPHDGQCELVSEESWSGILASILRMPMRKMLKKSLDTGLAHFQRRIETG